MGVELPDLRTADSQTFQKTDGTFVTKFYSGAVFFQSAGSDDWLPIDLRFESVAGLGINATSDHAPTRLELRAADDPTGFLSASDGEHTVSFKLPVGANPLKTGLLAKISADRRFADYVDLLPGIDLRVFPTASGSKSYLVLHQRPKETTFAFGVDAPGLSLREEKDGSVALVDAAGGIAGRIPRPYMMDSTVNEYRGSGNYSEDVTLSIGGSATEPQIIISADPSFLDQATYPVYIDPTVIIPDDEPDTSAGSTFVYSRYPDSNYKYYQREATDEYPAYHELQLGREPGTTYDTEAFIRFNGVADAMVGKRIDKAALAFFPYHQYYTYQWRPTWVKRVTEDWTASQVTWNDRPTSADDLWPNRLDSKKNEWAYFDVTDFYQEVQAGLADQGFRLHENGTGQGNWKRIISRYDASDGKPVLVIDWTTAELLPLYPVGAGETANRTLSWTYAGMGAMDAYQVQLSASSDFDTLLKDSLPVTEASGHWTIPPSVSLTDGVKYWWRVKGKFGGQWMDYWVSQSFTWREGANLGVAAHNTFESFDLGNGDSLAVNVSTGNLVLAHPVTSLPYRGGTLGISLAYNSQSTLDVGTGLGWRMSVMRRLTEKGNGDVIFRAADGSEHLFTDPVTVGTLTTYTRPATLYATLVKDTAATYRWTLTYRDQSVDYFKLYSTGTGLLGRSEDRFGNGIDFTYTAGTNRLYRATDPSGRYVAFTWDTSSSPAHLTSFTDWAYVSGGVVQAGNTGARRLYRFFYDGAGHLTGWSSPRNTTGVCPPGNNLTCLSYTNDLLTGVAKRQVYATLAGGAIGSAGRPVATVIAYRGKEVASVKLPGQSSAEATAFTRPAAAKMRVVRDGVPPSSTVYGFVAGTDDLGRVESTWRAVAGSAIERYVTWDAAFPTEPAAVTDNRGGLFDTPEHKTSYAYVAGSLGLVSRIDSPTIGSDFRRSAYVYNANNDVTQLTVSKNGTSPKVVTRFCYPSSGCSVSGSTLTMRAQIRNYVDGTKGGAAGATEDITLEYTYDAYGQRLSEQRFNYDAGGAFVDSRRTGYAYDAYGNLTNVVANYADGDVTGGNDTAPGPGVAYTDLTTAYTYDTAGNQVSIADPRRAIAAVTCASALRADDFVSRSTYDPTNLRLSEESPTTLELSGCLAATADSRTAVFTYDPLGDLREATDFGGLVSASALDADRNVTASFEEPPAESAYKIYAATYDAAGRVQTSKDARQVADSSLGETSYEYDELGRVTSAPEAAGSETEAGYDALSDQTGFAYGAGSDQGAGAGVASAYDYDVGGRVVAQDDGFACTSYSNDYRDLVTEIAEGRDSDEPGSPCTGTASRTTTNTYDGLGRLTYGEARDGSDAFESSRTFVYDSAGNVRASTSTVGGVTTTVSYTLDRLDQVTSETAPDGSTTSTTYDAAGNVAVRTTGAGTVTYTYDARNRLIRLVDSAAGSTAVYDPDHNYQMSAFYLGTKADGSHEHQTLYSYDGRHRLVTVVHQQCNSVGANHACSVATTQTGRDEYAYDENDNRTHVEEWKNTSSSSTDYFYCYDSQDQLTRRQSDGACSSSDYDQKYVYDAAGNRTKTVVGGTTTDFAYNADGQLCKVGGTSCSSANVTYGAAGRTKTVERLELQVRRPGPPRHGMQELGLHEQRRQGRVHL